MKINTVPNTLQQGRAHDFYWGQDRRPRAGMGFLGGAVLRWGSWRSLRG